MTDQSPPRPARALAAPLALTALLALAAGCNPDSALGDTSIDGLAVQPRPDMSSVPGGSSPPPQDMGPPPVDLAIPPPLDMYAPDSSPEGGASGGAGALPDGGVPMGSPCDPRLHAVACEQGYVCSPIPGGQVHQGRCEQGDGCDLLTGDPCGGDAPQCQLAGLATRCGSPAPARGLGQPCLDEFNRALPCAEGLICNFSVCTPACDPAADPAADPPDPDAALCATGQRCVDLSGPLGQTVGYCGAYGECDPATHDGCAPDELCGFGVRPDDLRVVTFCAPAGALGEGEPCRDGGGLDESCGRGLLCLGPMGGQLCRRLCDTGAYLNPCPSGQACRERIVLGGVPVYNVGLCITNP